MRATDAGDQPLLLRQLRPRPELAPKLDDGLVGQFSAATHPSRPGGIGP